MTVTLPSEIERQLREWASLAHTSPDDVVARALASFLAVPPDLREELEEWQQLGAEALERVAPLKNEAW